MSNNLGDPELIRTMNKLSDDLPKAVALMGKYGREYSEADVNYRREKAKAIARLRAAGESVTLITDLIYNDEIVADALGKRDQLEAMYKTAQENINAIKVQIRVLEEQVKREWAE